MKEKLIEARDIVGELMADVEGRYPVGLIRVHRLLEQVLADWWDDDDTAALPLCFPDEPPFPAA